MPSYLARRLRHLRVLRLAVVRWLRQPMPPALLGWRLWSRDDVMRVHRRSLAAAVGRHPYLRWLAVAAAAALWPLKSLVLIARYTREFGPEVATARDRSRARQALDQLQLAWLQSVSPYAYYAYGLSRPDLRRRASRFLYDGEAQTLLQSLNEDASARLLTDKLAFGRHLRNHVLPGVPTIAWTQRGTLRFDAAASAGLPPRDLFVKPVAGFGGRGAMLWEFLGGGLYSSESGASFCEQFGVRLPGRAGTAVLHAADLCSLIVAVSSREDVLVQPRLVNHADLADLSTGALLSLRVLTGCVDGRSEFIRASFKMPIGRSIVTNFGIVAPVDPERGVLGAATPFGPSSTRHDRHPGTGATIVGRRLPCWEDARRIAVAAHATLPGNTFVAWDIALTPDGVAILEGNAGWGTESLQKPHDSPLMETAFLPICLARIDQQRAQRRADRRARRFTRSAAPPRG